LWLLVVVVADQVLVLVEAVAVFVLELDYQ
jgi:hypothetical protein